MTDTPWANDPVVQATPSQSAPQPWANDPVVKQPTGGTSTSGPWENDPEVTNVSNTVALAGKFESQNLEGAKQDVEQAFQPTQLDNSAGPSWLQSLGQHVGGLVMGIGGAVTSPLTSTVAAVAGKPLAKWLQPDATEGQQEGVAQAIGGAASGLALAGAGALHAPEVLSPFEASKPEVTPEATPSQPPILDSAYTHDQLQATSSALTVAKENSLGQLALAARNPTTLDATQIDSKLTGGRPLADINQDIKDTAADTSIPGAKERLSALQAEKDDVQNPAKDLAGKLTDEQIQTNLKYPAQNALDSGATVDEVRATLQAHLPVGLAGQTPEYHQAVIDQVIPQANQNVAEAAPTIASTSGLDHKETESILQGTGYANTNIDSPNVVKQASQPQLSAANVQTAVGSGPISRFFHGLKVDIQNNYAVLDNLNRAYAKTNGINLGRPDLVELSDTTEAKNLSERGDYYGQNYLGAIDGSTPVVHVTQPGTSELIPRTDLQPYNTLKVNAVNSGVDVDTLNRVNLARNALDDYANLERVGQQSLKDINDNEQLISKLQEQRTSGAATLNFFDNYQLQRQIDSLKNENMGTAKFISQLNDRQTYMPKEEALTTMETYRGNPAVQSYMDGLNNLHDQLLTDATNRGRITPELAQKLRDTHPNYIPAFRTPDDYSFNVPQRGYFSGIKNAFIKRDIGSRGSDQIDPEGNIIRNIISTTKKNDAARVKEIILNNLLKTLNPTDEAWNLLFRENKGDVLKAMDALKNTDKQAFTSDEITPEDPTKIQNFDKVTFYTGGKQLQLSVVDSNLFKAISGAYKFYEEPTLAVKSAFKLAKLERNAIIVLDPSFPLRTTFRGTEEFAVNGIKALPGKDYLPVFGQAKQIASTFFDKEFYNKWSLNYGFGNKLSHDYEGLNSDQIVKAIKEGGSSSTIMGKMNAIGHDYASRMDAGNRLLQFKLYQKQALDRGIDPAKAYEGAMYAAKMAHLNFGQKGASSGINMLTRSMPFSRTWLNAMDLNVNKAIFTPKVFAAGAVGLLAADRAINMWNHNFKMPDGTSPVDHLDERRKGEQGGEVIYYGNGVNDFVVYPHGWVRGRMTPAMAKTYEYTKQQTLGALNMAGEKTGNNILKNTPELQGKLTGKELFSAWSDWAFGFSTPESMLPVPFNTAMEYATNQTNLGQNIVPPNLAEKNAPNFTQYYASSTDPGVVDFTRDLYTKYGVDISPGRVEYFTREFTGALGHAGLVAGAHIYGAANGKAYPTLEAGQYPGVSSFMGDNSNVPHEGIENQYYNIWSKLQQVDTTASALAKMAETYPEVTPKYQQFLRDHSTELAMVDQFKATNKALSDLRTNYGQVIASPSDKGSFLDNVAGDKDKRTSLDNNRIDQINLMKGQLKSIQDNLDNPNTPTNDIWAAKNTVKPATAALLKLFPSENPSKALPGPENSLDNSPKVGYNKLNDIFGGNMHSDTPPAIVQEASQEAMGNQKYEPGFFEEYLPNIRNGTVSMYRDAIVDATMQREGAAFTNTPGDRGGATKYGVTLATLKSVNPTATAEDVQNLTEQQAKNIYVANYWDKGQVTKMPVAIQDLAFDMNINHGLGGSTIIMQKALNDLGSNVAVDGKLGTTTLNALNQYDGQKLRDAIIQERENWVDNIVKNDPSQEKFLPGWKSRISSMQEIPAATTQEA